MEWKLKLFNKLTNEELYAILQLRQRVFIVEQNCPYLDNDGKDFYAHHLWVLGQGQIAAYCRLLPAGISYEEVSIGRVITAPEMRGKGYGQKLMAKALETIEELYGPVPVRIGAQAYLRKFYEDFGFVDVGEPYLEDGIPHLIMLRT